MNHREVLGVSTTATSTEIQSAFRKAAMEVHPDHSDSAEAAEAFARIKEARDELMKRTQESEVSHSDESTQRATASAVRATTAAAFAAPPSDDLFDGMTPEEVTHVQMLDQLVFQSTKKSLFKRRKESREVKRHRKKLKTNERRLKGLY